MPNAKRISTKIYIYIYIKWHTYENQVLTMDTKSGDDVCLKDFSSLLYDNDPWADKIQHWLVSGSGRCCHSQNICLCHDTPIFLIEDLSVPVSIKMTSTDQWDHYTSIVSYWCSLIRQTLKINRKCYNYSLRYTIQYRKLIITNILLTQLPISLSGIHTKNITATENYGSSLYP